MAVQLKNYWVISVLCLIIYLDGNISPDANLRMVVSH